MVLKTNEQAKLLAEAIAILDELSALIFEHGRPRLGLHDMQQQVVRKPFAVFEKMHTEVHADAYTAKLAEQTELLQMLMERVAQFDYDTIRTVQFDGSYLLHQAHLRKQL